MKTAGVQPKSSSSHKNAEDEKNNFKDSAVKGVRKLFVGRLEKQKQKKTRIVGQINE